MTDPVRSRFRGQEHAGKYHSRNPVARAMVDHFAATLLQLAGRTGAPRVHEVGCGEGHLCSILAAAGYQVRGCDLDAAAIARARAEAAEQGLAIDFQVRDLFTQTPDRDAEELVVCLEVLEHLEEPERAMEVLVRLARPHLIVSVPREPVWRLLNMARGRYLGSLGNTPGHIRHWSASRFVAFVSRYAEVREVRKPLPWTMLLCRCG